MPPKIRDLERELKRAGFVRVSAKGSHRKYVHRSGAQVTVSGQGGADAKPYQEDNVQNALRHVHASEEE